MIADHALEANRRLAWAKFYEQRAEVAELQLIAGELVEWADVALRAARWEVPPAFSSLAGSVRARLTPRDLAMLRTFVGIHAAEAVA